MRNIINKILLTGLLATASLTMSAQARIAFENEINRTGEIIFQMPKQVTFNFQNKGNQPLTINDVKPGCGCTQVDWTRGEILPGAKGTVKVTYDAKLLGSFSKEVAVYSNASKDPVYLHMEGRVVTNMINTKGDFPIDLGSVRLSTNYLEFDDVNRGDHPTAELQVFNTERTPYRPELMHLPNYLSARYVPEVVAGGRVGRVLVTLDSEKLGLLGLNQTRIYLSRFMGDKVSEQNEIQVSSVLLPDFSNMTEEQVAQAPVMTFSANELDFSDMQKKSKMTKEVTITNTGKSALTIRTVQVFNTAVSVSVGDRTLEPGKSTTMKVTLSARYLKKAKSRPRVLIISNDPKHAKQIINIIL